MARLNVVIGMMFLSLGTQAWGATGGTLTDGVVSLHFPATHWDPGNFYAQVEWKGTESVPAGNVLTRLGFWYRLNGTDTFERRLPAPTTETYSGPLATFSWINLDGRDLDLSMRVEIGDAEAPSGWMKVHALLTNHNPASQTVSFFTYLDADAGATPAGDVAELRAPGLVGLHDNSTGDTVRLQPLSPNTKWRVRSVGASDNVLGQLDDAAVTELDNSGLPSSAAMNLALAFENTTTLTSGGTGLVESLALSSRAPADVVKGDMDGSGTADLIFQYPASASEFGWYMRRSEFSGSGYSRSTSGRTLRGVDRLDATKRFNSLVEQDSSGQVFVDLLPLLGAPVLAANWHLSATGDFNGDGLGDLVWRNDTSQKIVVWTMNGRTKTGAIVPTPDQAADANWEIVGALDFDNDGWRDLLWYNQTSGKLVIWHMDGTLTRISGTFTNPASAGGSNWRPVAVGDYGRGGGPVGAPDIVWRNDTSGKLVVWLMDFAGNRVSGVFTTPDAPANALAAVVAGPR